MKKTLLLSKSDSHGKKTINSLIAELEKNQIPTLLTLDKWPRDQFYFHPDGKFNLIYSQTLLSDISDHFAHLGCSYLKGDDFAIISKTAVPEGLEKEKETKEVLKTNNFFYFDITKQHEALKNIKVSNNKKFYAQDYAHIDTIFNITNASKNIFTYDHPELIEKAEEIANKCKYTPIILPLEDAKYAGIGFVEFENKIIMDGRCEKTKSILEQIGYEVISTPKPLIKTNNDDASLRCITNEIPIAYEKFTFIKRDINKYYSEIMTNTNNDIVQIEMREHKFKLKN